MVPISDYNTTVKMRRDKADLFKFRRWIVLSWLDVFLLYLDWVDYKKFFLFFYSLMQIMQRQAFLSQWLYINKVVVLISNVFFIINEMFLGKSFLTVHKNFPFSWPVAILRCLVDMWPICTSKMEFVVSARTWLKI